MKTAIGITSASRDQRFAKVWKRKLPMPTTATAAIRNSAGRSLAPARRQRAKAKTAATRNAAFDSVDRLGPEARVDPLAIGIDRGRPIGRHRPSVFGASALVTGPRTSDDGAPAPPDRNSCGS